MADGFYRGVYMAQLPVEFEVLFRNAITGITIDGRGAESQGGESFPRCADECVLCGWFQRNIVAVGPTYFTKRRNIGADYPAMVKHGFDNGQAKAFDQRRRQQQFAMLVAPFQFGVRNSAKEDDLALQVQLLDGAMNVFRLRTFDANHHQQGRRVDLLFPQQALKDLQSKHYVLVPAVLGNTEEKWLTIPRGNRAGSGDRRPRIDAIVDGDGAARGKRGSIKGETAECRLGNARDFVSRTQALLQYHAVEQNLRKAEVRRDIVWIEIMKSDDRGAAERSPI